MKPVSSRWYSLPELGIGVFVIIFGYLFGLPMVMDALIKMIGGEIRDADSWGTKIINGAALIALLILTPVGLGLVALFCLAAFAAWSLVNLISPQLADRLFDAKPDPTRIPPLRPA